MKYIILGLFTFTLLSCSHTDRPSALFTEDYRKDDNIKKEITIEVDRVFDEGVKTQSEWNELQLNNNTRAIQSLKDRVNKLEAHTEIH